MYRILYLVIFCLLAVAPQIMALDTDGLVGAWLFDDKNGDTVSDSSGNGIDGKIAKGNPEWVGGKFGGAMEFGGADMVTVDDNAALDLKSFTLSAWVNIPKVTGPWQIIASKENRNPLEETMAYSEITLLELFTIPLQREQDGNRLMPPPL